MHMMVWHGIIENWWAQVVPFRRLAPALPLVCPSLFLPVDVCMCVCVYQPATSSITPRPHTYLSRSAGLYVIDEVRLCTLRHQPSSIQPSSHPRQSAFLPVLYFFLRMRSFGRQPLSVVSVLTAAVSLPAE